MNNSFNYFFINSGNGRGKTDLTSFDAAMLDAGMGNYNLVRVSSILPVHCKQVYKINLFEGSPLHVAYASITSNAPRVLIAAAVSVGIPLDKSKIGVIMEYSAETAKENAEKHVERMVIESMSYRNYAIDKIITASCEVLSTGESYVTAFAGISMW